MPNAAAAEVWTNLTEVEHTSMMWDIVNTVPADRLLQMCQQMSRYRNSHHGQRAMTGGDDQDEDKEKKRLDDGGDAQEPTMTSTTAARTQTQNATTSKGPVSAELQRRGGVNRGALGSCRS